MDKEVLEVVLKNRFKENSIDKILAIETEPAVEKYRNFLSTVSRLKLTVILGNGRKATRYLITKEAQGQNDMGQQFIVQYNPFVIEIMMYKTILNEMEYLMAEFEDTDDILWCNVVHCIPNSLIVLEDLRPKGFEMVEKSYFFDLDHGLMAVHALGKFHAMSKVLEERGIFSKENFKPWYAFTNQQMMNFGLMALMATVEGVKLHWEPKWKSLAEKVVVSPQMMQEKMVRMGQVELSFNVVCHGDCNKNNFLFKYDWNKRPTALKLIDYQMSFYGSPCCDLNHIMYCCIDPEVRRTNFDLFMKTYHESLCSSLDRFKYSGSRPSLEDIMEGMDTYSFLGYWLFISFYPSLAMGDEIEKYVDIQKIFSTGGKEGYDLALYKLDILKKAIAPDFEVFINKFF